MYRIGVDRIQGFYFARPMPEDNLRMVFAEQEKNRMVSLQVDNKKNVAVRYAGKSEKMQKLAFAEAADEEAAKNFVSEYQDKVKKTVNFSGE